MLHDTALFDLIQAEGRRQKDGIELIASENYVSDDVMRAMGSCLTNKYAEGYPGRRYYGGCQVVDQVESLAIERIKQLFGAEYANVQPHSGAQANMTVFLACLQPGDKFIEQMEEVCRRERPKLIIGGASAYSREWDYARMRALADEIGAIFMVDMAHPAGLIAAGLLDNPVKHAHIVTSTTHKTLRGPRGGIILMGRDFVNPWGKKSPKGEPRMMSQILDSALFPGVQGGPLEHVIAAKAVAFHEALQPEFRTYQTQVKANAAALASAMSDMGYKIVSGGTDNHCILIDLRTKFPELTGKVAERVLVEADITANKNMVPYDSRSPFQTSGIRLGTPAITTRGVKEDLMGEIVEMIDTVLNNVENTQVIDSVRAKVNSIMTEYPMFAY